LYDRPRAAGSRTCCEYQSRETVRGYFRAEVQQMKPKHLGAAALLAALGATSTASATEALVTYTGTILSGTDYAGIFGPAGADLARDKFVAQYVIDPSLAGIQLGGPGDDYEQYIGGSSSKGGSPVLSADLTINGQTYDFTVGQYGNLYGQNTTFPGLSSQQSHTDSSQITVNSILHTWFISNYIQTYGTNPIPKSLTTPFSYKAMSGDGTGEQWWIDEYLDPQTQTPTYDALGVFNSMTITVSSIPEPSAWTMLIAGFTALGFAAARRTKGSPQRGHADLA
jgi:hypothetical protein